VKTKPPSPGRGHRRTGHWLSDAVYSLPRKHGRTAKQVSREALGNADRATEIARTYPKALADLDTFFEALGYSLELVPIEQ